MRNWALKLRGKRRALGPEVPATRLLSPSAMDAPDVTPVAENALQVVNRILLLNVQLAVYHRLDQVDLVEHHLYFSATLNLFGQTSITYPNPCGL